jgi:hypothetical protein
MANNTNDLGLPPMSFIDEVFPQAEIPEFNRKYTKRQGPASTKKDAKGRTFTIGGAAANRILQCIFANQGLTRGQIAKVVGCSPSRVTEVIWGLEFAVKRGEIQTFPAVPRQPGLANDEEEDDVEYTANEY